MYFLVARTHNQQSNQNIYNGFKNLQILHVHIWRIWKWRWDFVESESSIAKDFFLDLDLICTASPTKVGRAHFKERLLSQKLKSLGAKSSKS